jgi:hypothetical protein
MQRSLAEQYRRATQTAKPSTFPRVLHAAALARSDEYGAFSPSDIAAVDLPDGRQLTINAVQYPLGKLITDERDKILVREGQERRYRYRFANPMMRQYILLYEANKREVLG